MRRVRSWQRRIVIAGALTVFVVGFVLLYVQSHNTNERRTSAARSVKDNAQRYARGVVDALSTGPLTGSRLLALRDAIYRNGGGLSQGITHVGASAAGHRLIVTYQVQVNFRGSFHSSAQTISCYYAVVSTGSTVPTLTSLSMLGCQHLLPAVSPATVLRPT